MEGHDDWTRGDPRGRRGRPRARLLVVVVVAGGRVVVALAHDEHVAVLGDYLERLRARLMLLVVLLVLGVAGGHLVPLLLPVLGATLGVVVVVGIL